MKRGMNMNERLINDCCFDLARDMLSIVAQLVPDEMQQRDVFAACYEAARQRLLGYEMSRERLRQRLCEPEEDGNGNWPP